MATQRGVVKLETEEKSATLSVKSSAAMGEKVDNRVAYRAQEQQQNIQNICEMMENLNAQLQVSVS